MFPDPDFLLRFIRATVGASLTLFLGTDLPLGHWSEVGGMWELCYVVKSEMMTSDGLEVLSLTEVPRKSHL